MGDFESNGAGSLKNNAKCKVVVREYKKKGQISIITHVLVLWMLFCSLYSISQTFCNAVIVLL